MLTHWGWERDDPMYVSQHCRMGEGVGVRRVPFFALGWRTVPFFALGWRTVGGPIDIITINRKDKTVSRLTGWLIQILQYI